MQDHQWRYEPEADILICDTCHAATSDPVAYFDTCIDDSEPPVEGCPVCGSPIDYCPGHGEISDPTGHAILNDHDHGNHRRCDPYGCDYADQTSLI